MPLIAPATHLLDLHWLGQPEYIATAVLETGDGLVLVDPGPSTSLSRLEAGLADAGRRLEDVCALLLTHIHLDHAGASGLLARRLPRLRVHVHARGARHLADPGKLVASATRIYGPDQMERLWGEIAPVPADRLVVLEGGETLDLGGRYVEVAWTPGHAVHHVCYFDRDTETAFVGDVAGERFPGTDEVLPATPPPDIDVEQLIASVARVRQWAPARIFLTHFGPFDDVAAHLDQHDARLREHAAWVRASLDEPGEDAARARAFADRVLAGYRSRLPAGVPDRVHPDAIASGWYGLARYWRTRTPAPDATE